MSTIHLLFLVLLLFLSLSTPATSLSPHDVAELSRLALDEMKRDLRTLDQLRSNPEVVRRRQNPALEDCILLLDSAAQGVHSAAQALGVPISKPRVDTKNTPQELKPPKVTPRRSFPSQNPPSQNPPSQNPPSQVLPPESPSSQGPLAGQAASQAGTSRGGGVHPSRLLDLAHALSCANSRRTLCTEVLNSAGIGGALAQAQHLPAALTAVSRTVAGRATSMPGLADLGPPSFRRRLSAPEYSGKAALPRQQRHLRQQRDAVLHTSPRQQGAKGITVNAAGRQGRVSRTPWGLRADSVVDINGHGNFRTLQEAIQAAPRRSRRPFVIYIKRGYYKMRNFRFDNTNITLVGDGPGETVLWGDEEFKRGRSLLKSSNLVVLGDGFAAIGITFFNRATRSQGVAVMVSSDKAVFWNCNFRGYQDTLCAWSGRQLYFNCTVHGFVDFIFGNAAAVFQSSTIKQVLNETHGPGVIMASGRRDRHEPTGLIFVDGRVEAQRPGAKTYLGRPWQEYSRMVYINTRMTDVILPAGWLSWNGNLWNNHPYYAEYDSKGPGAGRRRVSWAKPGQIRWNDAKDFMPRTLLDFNSWIGSTSMPNSFHQEWKRRRKN